MTETATTETAGNGESPDNPFTSRIRTSLALAQTRLSEVAKGPAEWSSKVPKLPAQIQAAVDRAIDTAKVKLRDTLDLPSREDLVALAERIEALDLKIAKLQAVNAELVDAPAKPRATKKTGAKKTGAKKSAVDKGKRRDAIKASASKSSRTKSK